jgi:NAD(P)-dependent dehydrogenase (short-subunit alcohol dehydrogenase family)
MPSAGSHAVITGAAGDIGSAMTAELLRAGFRVTAVDAKPETQAAQRLASWRSLGEVDYAEADVRSRDELSALLNRVPPVDVAIGNAGLGGSSAFLELPERLWSETLAVNLSGNFHLGQLVAHQMVARGQGGRIIFTGSWVQEVPWPDITAYAVSKAGLHMLAKQMAKELAPHRILVNLVAPGIVDAGLAGQLRRTDPDYARRAPKAIPLGEFQTPQQVAAVTAFLCSPAADYMTGSVLLADGGCSLFANQDT